MLHRWSDPQFTCDLASSTSILAAGWVTIILFKMVAPSLVMMTSPSAWQTCTRQRRGSAAGLCAWMGHFAIGQMATRYAARQSTLLLSGSVPCVRLPARRLHAVCDGQVSRRSPRWQAVLPLICMQSGGHALRQLAYHFVHPARTQAGPDCIGNCFCGLNVGDADIFFLGVLAAAAGGGRRCWQKQQASWRQ